MDAIDVFDVVTKTLIDTFHITPRRYGIQIRQLGPIAYIAGGMQMPDVLVMDMRNYQYSNTTPLRGQVGYTITSAQGIGKVFFGGYGPSCDLVDYYDCGNGVRFLLVSGPFLA